MPAKTVFMFSGQGSQYYQMGRQLFQENEVFRYWMMRLDRVAEGVCGERVLDQIYAREKSITFDRILHTNPAIFMIEYSLAQCLIDSGIKPDLVLGSSLGTFAAAAVGGYISADHALEAVIRQAMVYESTCEEGGMIAIMANPALYQEHFLNECSELAGINFENHFVVSAPLRYLDGIEAALKQRNLIYQRLAVRFPFHSRWIDQVRDAVIAIIHAFPLGKGSLPLVCCEQAATLPSISGDHFWRVVRNPIRFRDSLAHLEQSGPWRYIDVGPAGTLATFAKYGLPTNTTSTTHAVLTPYGQDQKNLAALVASS